MSMTEPPVPHEPPVLNRQPHIRVAKSSYGGGLLRKLNASIRSNWYETRGSRPVVCPGKVGMFSRRQTCRGKSQSPVVWIAEVMETETLKPIDEISLGEVTSHRAVTKVNALWPRK